MSINQISLSRMECYMAMKVIQFCNHEKMRVIDCQWRKQDIERLIQSGAISCTIVCVAGGWGR